MSGIQKRSPVQTNLTEFRHPAFFEDNPRWVEAQEAYDAYVQALAEWVMSGEKGTDGEPDTEPDPATRPQPVDPPSLEMFRDTEEDVVWVFSIVKTGVETDEIVGLMTGMAIKWKELTEQYAAGDEDAVPTITEPQRSAYRRAELSVMTEEVRGEFFRIPADYTVGDAKRTKDTTPHVLAGQMMPIDPTWLRLLGTERVPNEELLQAAHLHLVQSYVRRTPQKEESFPAGVIPLPDAEHAPDRRGKGGTRAPRVPQDSAV